MLKDTEIEPFYGINRSVAPYGMKKRPKDLQTGALDPFRLAGFGNRWRQAQARAATMPYADTFRACTDKRRIHIIRHHEMIIHKSYTHQRHTPC